MFRGTLLGGLAILSWGGLGLLGALSAGMPPELVLACCFGIAALMGFAIGRMTGRSVAPIRNRANILFAALLSAYHLVYLEAFHHAEAIPVSLINYLWPACLILLGNLFFRLHSGLAGYAGAALGFAGVTVLVGKDGFSLSAAQSLGYLLAFVGALLWALFSNLRRHDRSESIGAMSTICLLSSIICGLWWLAKGAEMPALGTQDLIVITLLGLGPAGGAFYLWDIGMRSGNAALLGVMGYSAPVLSTLLMVLFGMGAASVEIAIALALALITGGGLIVQLGAKKSAQTRVSSVADGTNTDDSVLTPETRPR